MWPFETCHLTSAWHGRVQFEIKTLQMSTQRSTHLQEQSEHPAQSVGIRQQSLCTVSALSRVCLWMNSGILLAPLPEVHWTPPTTAAAQTHHTFVVAICSLLKPVCYNFSRKSTSCFKFRLMNKNYPGKNKRQIRPSNNFPLQQISIVTDSGGIFPTLPDGRYH